MVGLGGFQLRGLIRSQSTNKGTHITVPIRRCVFPQNTQESLYVVRNSQRETIQTMFVGTKASPPLCLPDKVTRNARGSQLNQLFVQRPARQPLMDTNCSQSVADVLCGHGVLLV